MSRFRRANTGTTFFFTVIAYHRRPILCDPLIRTALRNALHAVRILRPFTIDAWVLLPDHMHCIWTLPIKHRVSYACGDAYRIRPSMSGLKRGEATIWQRRFWEHQIRDDLDMQRHMDYVHFNPVKHGHVDNVAAWPYSTFGRWVKAGLYATDWGGGLELDRLDFE